MKRYIVIQYKVRKKLFAIHYLILKITKVIYLSNFTIFLIHYLP